MRKHHWRMRWDPNADLVVTRRVRAGTNPKKPFLLPGDKVGKRLRERLGPNRLRRWFETGIVAIADWQAPEPARAKALREKDHQERELAKRLRTDGPKLRAELEADLLTVDGDRLRSELESDQG